MKRATVRQLRQEFPSVLALLNAGETVQVTLRGQPVARLTPVKPRRQTPRPWPDFAARLRRIYGSRVLPASQPLLDQLRGDR